MSKNMYEQLPFFELKALCANYLSKKEYHPSIAAYVKRLNERLVESNLTDEQIEILYKRAGEEKLTRLIKHL